MIRPTFAAVAGCLRILAVAVVWALASAPAHGQALYTWGNNNNGQLGDGTTTSRTAPVAIVGFDFGIDAVSAGHSHSLAIQNGAAKAWGRNISGQLGDATNTNQSTPVAVTGLSSGVRKSSPRRDSTSWTMEPGTATRSSSSPGARTSIDPRH